MSGFNPDKISKELIHKEGIEKDNSVFFAERNIQAKKVEIESNNFESIQKKITEEMKIDEIKNQLEKEYRDSNISAFINELPHIDNAINLQSLHKLGQGGTHDVFMDQQSPKFVVKLNRGLLEKAKAINQQELSLDIQQQVNKYIENENHKYEELYKYFGNEHCIREKVIAEKINVGEPSAPQPISAILSVQETSDVFTNPTKQDFGTTYIEKDSLLDQKKEIYDRMNEGLLGGGEFNEKDYLELNEKVKPIFELINNDPQFADCMREFLMRFKNYYSETSRFIDLVGEQNALFHQKDGKWTFTLGSVIKAEQGQIINEALGQDPEVLNDNAEMKSQLMNQLALVRLFNATGLKTGLGKLIDVHLPSQQLANLDKLNFN